MSKYRKKPLVIEAMPLDTIPPSDELRSFLDRKPGGWAWNHFGVELDTLEGRMHVSLGDWIIRGVAGEFYPCKPDVFAVTYDKVDDAD
jgi:hypothetical protein